MSTSNASLERNVLPMVLFIQSFTNFLVKIQLTSLYS